MRRIGLVPIRPETAGGYAGDEEITAVVDETDHGSLVGLIPGCIHGKSASRRTDLFPVRATDPYPKKWALRWTRRLCLTQLSLGGR